MNAEKQQSGSGIHPDLEDVAGQVLKNCLISDAKHAGLFSICGLALRLRDLYKWEKQLPVWEEKDPSEILEWIGEKEESWEAISSCEFSDLSILGTKFDPFDTSGINDLLAPYGVFYGAGYANSLKPTFFLAAIESIDRINETDVVLVGKEFARDLLTLPALSQDDVVVLRRQAALLYLWDQILYINKSGKPAFSFAMESMGIDPGDTERIRLLLPEIFEAYKEAFIYHEIGEITDRGMNRATWREMIATYPKSPVELLARTIKDLLADTCPRGTLRHMIRYRQSAALGLHVAFISGLAKEMFPQLRRSFLTFSKTGDWRIMENAVAAGYKNARSHAALMTDIHQSGKKRKDSGWAKQEIEVRMLSRLQNKQPEESPNSN